jgi:hypothetical protein
MSEHDPSEQRPEAKGGLSAEPAFGEQRGSTPKRACRTCGGPLERDQDWCTECGAAAKSSRALPGWRSAAAVIGGAAVLALGAAAAAYAALNQSSPAAASPPVETVAQTPPTTTETTKTTTAITPGVPAETPETLPEASSKPPKIPSSTPTPKGESSEGLFGEGGEGNGGGAKGKEGEESKGSGKGGGGEGAKHGGQGGGNGEGGNGCEASGSEGEESEAEAEEQLETSGTQTSSTEAEELEARELEEGGCPGEEATKGAKRAPIVLKGKAASTYDPNGYPEADFVGPKLAIDGITTTAWTAATAPELSPKVHGGLLLDLAKKRRIAKVGVISRTLGMTVEVFGTAQRHAPKSIESQGWRKLSGVHLVEERNSSIVLKRMPEVRQLLIWVLKAPEVEPEVEGEEVTSSVAINEVALYERR